MTADTADRFRIVIFHAVVPAGFIALSKVHGGLVEAGVGSCRHADDAARRFVHFPAVKERDDPLDAVQARSSHPLKAEFPRLLQPADKEILHLGEGQDFFQVQLRVVFSKVLSSLKRVCSPAVCRWHFWRKPIPFHPGRKPRHDRCRKAECDFTAVTQ